ncbi:MAG TPA: SUF system NifU family Fe-S cluster assembly protein [Candidatus Hydrogenedentes bacterium]|nr:SUF system NifU family Fe-S cluster assembly protein [Candidatus Hydrogenedentota bacterium]
MADSRNLYEQVILDHNKNPRNYGKPAAADTIIDGLNPLCGDSFKIYVAFQNDVIECLHFEGDGCALSKASASLMTVLLEGKTREAALELEEALAAMLKSSPDTPVDESILGPLAAFSGVREYPTRIKCVMVAWQALAAAFSNRR